MKLRTILWFCVLCVQSYYRFVLGTDKAGTLISDLTSFLDECAKNNIFMGLVLFNGAVLRNQDTINLFWDDSKLETYLSKALTPMVEALRDHPALGFWEVGLLNKLKVQTFFRL